MNLKDAPRAAYIEHQIFVRAAKSGALVGAVREIEKDYDLREGSLKQGLFMQTRVLCLLFHLIVLPRELSIKLLGMPEIQDAWGIWSRKCGVSFELEVFLANLRNAVAHGDLLLDEKNIQFPQKGGSIQLSIEQLESFLETVGATLANEAGRLPEPASKSGRGVDGGLMRGV